MEQPLAGWYPDPAGDKNKLRYWDGKCWTANFRSVTEGAEGAPSDEGGTGNAGPTVRAYSLPNEEIQGQKTQVRDRNSTLRLIAFIFMVASCAIGAPFILPLIWRIPMTLRGWKIYKGEAPNTVAFDVCTLVFTSFIGGILLLCSSKDN